MVKISPQNKKIYKAKKSYYLVSGLVYFILIFFLLTLPVIIQGGQVGSGKLAGLIGFWVIGILLVVVQMTMRVEIEGDEVRSYMFGFRILKLRASDVKSITYGNLMRAGGLGFGKGLIIRVNVNGRGKSLTVGEKLYGKEAIENIKRVLNNS